MKQRLLDYREIERDIDNTIERLEYLEVKKGGVASARLDGMPKAQGRYNRIEELICQCLQLETELKEKIKHRDEERKIIIEIMTVSALTADERSIIEMRYFDMEDWETVIKLLYGRNSDFEEVYDNYKQRVFRHHKTAVSKMNRLFQKQAQSGVETP